MKKKSAIWKKILSNLENNIQVMLLYVLESKGSSPGRQGFFMMINASGEINGSIGGGIMEHKFVELAKEKLSNANNHFEPDDIKKQFHDKSAAKDQSGMICSGEQTILFYHIKPEDKIAIANLISCIDENKNGQVTFSPKGLEFHKTVPEKNYHFEFRSNEDWLYQEKTGYKNHLFIVGGGHCALAFSKLMADMNFYIHIYDDRKGLNTIEENEYVHEKKILYDYQELSSLIQPGLNHYVVIMTFGYRSDDRALRAVIKKELQYIGLLGSQSKILKLIDDLKKDGISEEFINRIHAPIGLQIHSQTPEEIAVSIAAEIILVKNGLREKEE